MGEKYFNHHAKTNGSFFNFLNIFVSQGDLCKKFSQLESVKINPLTARLCLVQDAFCHLFEDRLRIRQKTSGGNYRYHPVQTVATSGFFSSVAAASGGMIGETFNLEIHRVYKDFYAYLSFFCSVLDRLAYEIHLIYGIGKQETIDWRQFKKKNGNYGPMFEQLKSKNGQLADIIDSQDFSMVFILRDSLEHGRDAKFDASDLDADFDYIVENCGSNIRIIDFSQSNFFNLLVVCESIYKCVITS